MRIQRLRKVASAAGVRLPRCSPCTAPSNLGQSRVTSGELWASAVLPVRRAAHHDELLEQRRQVIPCDLG